MLKTWLRQGKELPILFYHIILYRAFCYIFLVLDNAGCQRHSADTASHHSILGQESVKISCKFRRKLRISVLTGLSAVSSHRAESMVDTSGFMKKKNWEILNERIQIFQNMEDSICNCHVVEYLELPNVQNNLYLRDGNVIFGTLDNTKNWLETFVVRHGRSS